MRTVLMAALFATVFCAFGCSNSPDMPVEVREGPGYVKLSDHKSVRVLWLNLPERIDGSKDPGDEDKWRKEWPSHGATIMADAIVEGSGKTISARSAEKRPEEGWAIEVRITTLDVGDAGKRNASAFSTSSKEGWSNVVAECRIIDSKSGELAATCILSHRTGSVVAYSVPFENDMNAIGKQLGEWLAAR